ncbi:MAG: hypothetical protein V1818_02205 [Candidatus Aenigmatarchaeota archaeon]
MFHELECIKYSNEGFKLASGGTSKYKVFCDPLFKNREAREILCKRGYEMFQEIENGKTYDIVGIVTGGNEFAKMVAEIAKRDIISINPHTGDIKGKLVKNNVCYFDDIFTKGGTVLKCSALLRQAYPYIEDEKARGIVDRCEGAVQNLGKADIELRTILTVNDLGISIT